MTITMQAVTTTDTITVRIKGMRCEECAHKVNTVLHKLNGVKGIDYNLERRTAAIAYDKALTCRDTIEARLAATGRYKASAYSKDEVIRRGMGLRMDDMHCQKCADRIVKCLGQIEGVDSLAPKLDKQYVFVRYDANRTTKDVIRQTLTDLGFTPVNYYTGNEIGFAYFLIPEEAVNEETIETAIVLDGVDDANVNVKRKSLAITYFKKDTSTEKLMEQLKAEGIDATLPPPHECKEEKQQ